ncbi:MAG: DUF4302 domain-containing protein [Prevotellaceae bacterium]|nr:DUF4302 domain-containing protein [Prevotellaceae bacterium]
MKKILINSTVCLLSAILCFGITSCKNEEEDLFDKSAAERLNESVATFAERFSSSPAGWAFEYYPTTSLVAKTGTGYLILMNIKPDGTVSMAMDNEATTGYVEDSGLWEILKDTGPVLSFSTYTKCLHHFCDPSISPIGTGYGGDYEFIIIDMEENAQLATIKGKKTGAYVRMTRLPEGTVFKDYLDDVNSFQSKYFSSSAPNMLVLDLNGEQKYIRNAWSKLPNVYPVKGDSISNESYHPYMVTKRDGTYFFRFKNAMTVKEAEGETSTIQEFKWSEENGFFTGVENEKCTIKGEVPSDFFCGVLNKGANLWYFDAKSQMSESALAIVNEMNSQFKSVNKNYSVSYFQIQAIDEKECQLVIAYKTSRTATSKIMFKFNYENEGSSVKLTYTEPANTGSQNVMNKVSAINDLIQLLNGSNLIKYTDNPFNLSKLQIQSSANAENWIEVTIQ